MIVSGVRSSWLMSANMRRRTSSSRCSVRLARSSSPVRSRTFCSSPAWARISSARCTSRSPAMRLKLAARCASSSRPSRRMRCARLPVATCRVPSSSRSIGRLTLRSSQKPMPPTSSAATIARPAAAWLSRPASCLTRASALSVSSCSSAIARSIRSEKSRSIFWCSSARRAARMLRVLGAVGDAVEGHDACRDGIGQLLDPQQLLALAGLARANQARAPRSSAARAPRAAGGCPRG